MSKNRKVYQESLPKKRISANALFSNDDGEILLVKPVNKKVWLLPGGVVEKNESPRQGCIREIREEIGLDFVPDQLLSITYKPETKQRLEGLTFIFYGGVLTDAQISQISLPSDELSEFCFVDPERIQDYTSQPTHSRINQSLDAWIGFRTVYVDKTK